MTARTARLVLGVAVPLALVAMGAVVAVWANAGPDPLATHFTFRGDPDDTMSRTAFLALTLGGTAIGLVGATVTAWWGRRWPVTTWMTIAGTTTLVGATFAATGLVTTWSQRGVTSWTDARLSPLSALAVLVVSLGAGVGAARAARDLRVDPPPTLDPSTAPTLALQPAERVVWTGHLAIRWQVIAAGLLLVAVVMAGLLASPWAFVGVVLPLVMLVLASVTVWIDRDGLTVHYGVVPVVSTHIALDRIVRAEVIDVRPSEWGGWGYRGSVTAFGRAATAGPV
ncbi:MAG: hypothetical protein ACK5RL_03310 [Acidimicrobiales bacterium]